MLCSLSDVTHVPIPTQKLHYEVVKLCMMDVLRAMPEASGGPEPSLVRWPSNIVPWDLKVCFIELFP